MKPALMHGTDYEGQSLAGWFLAEKLDGWRAYWTGAELLTRQGERLPAPGWFLADLPDSPLDCELHAGRGTTHDDVNRLVLSRQWDALTLRPFDIPEARLPFPDALARLETLAPAFPAHVRPVAWRLVKSMKAAVAAMREIVSQGGEGAMVRHPSSAYRAGRSGNLLKLKLEFVPFEF